MTQAAEPSRLERMGQRYFRRLSARLPPPQNEDAVYILNREERQQLRRIERGGILRAALAGALSALIAAVAEMVASPLEATGAKASFSDQLPYWAVVLGVGGVATVIEILFLYWDSLRTVHQLSYAAGLDLRSREGDAGEQIVDLTRAALEIPNPQDPYLGVNPYRGASRISLFFFTVLYKLKISVTNFLFKFLVRRVAGRTALRAWVPLVAVPITAVWNGLVMWLILYQARIRCMAHSAVYEHVASILDRAPDLSKDGKEAAFRAVASAIVLSRDLHPGLRELLQHTYERLGKPEVTDLDDPEAILATLEPISEEEQTTALRFFVLAALIDGRISRKEWTLLRQAHEACGRSIDRAAVQHLQREYVRGNELEI